jgi:hypothetical protein
MKWKHVVMLLLWVGLGGYRVDAQDRFPVDVAQFAKQASEVTDVSLDKNMLQFASKFMSSGREDQEAQSIINHLNGIFVRDYTFKRPASYSAAAVEELRKHFHSPEWTQIVSTRSKDGGENTDIYVHTVGGRIEGMFVISAQPTELAFVHILGPIQPKDLNVLSGHFGVPSLREGKSGTKKDAKKTRSREVSHESRGFSMCKSARFFTAVGFAGGRTGVCLRPEV